MNIIQYALELSKVLEIQCTNVEILGEIDEHGAAWFFEIDDDTTGFVSCEDNAEDINLPTISIALKIADIADLSKEDLLFLLDINGNLFRAALTVANIDDKPLLLIQYKSTLEVFKPNEFIESIEHLIDQAELFVWDVK